MNFRSQIFRPKGVTILAITLVVGTLAMAGAIGIGIISMQDVKISDDLEVAEQAYRAANSGLELGMLYFNYNHDVALGTDCDNVQTNCPTIPTDTAGLPIRIYLDRLGCSPTKLKTGSCDTIKVNGATHYEPTTNTDPNHPLLPRVDNLPNNERVADLKIYYQQQGGVGKAAVLDSEDPGPPNNSNQILKADVPRDFALSGKLKWLDLHVAGLTVKNALITGTQVGDTWKTALANFKSRNSNKVPNPTNKGNQVDIDFFKQFCTDLNVESNKDTTKEIRKGKLVAAVPCGVYTIVDIPGMSPMTKYHPLREITELNPNPSKNHIKLTTGHNLRIKPLNMDIQFAMSNQFRNVLLPPK